MALARHPARQGQQRSLRRMRQALTGYLIGWLRLSPGPHPVHEHAVREGRGPDAGSPDGVVERKVQRRGAPVGELAERCAVVVEGRGARACVHRHPEVVPAHGGGGRGTAVRLELAAGVPVGVRGGAAGQARISVCRRPDRPGRTARHRPATRGHQAIVGPGWPRRAGLHAVTATLDRARSARMG